MDGKPLVSHTLEIAKKLSSAWLPFVSTDCPTVLEITKSLGLDDSYIRPSSLAGDQSPTIDSVFHAIDWLKKEKGVAVENVLLLQPTSPLRSLDEVQSAISTYEQLNCSSLISVHPMREHPYECVHRKNEGWEYLKSPINEPTRRQDYSETFYFIDGSIYIASIQFLRNHNGFIKPSETHLFEVSSEFNIDIDDPADLVVAESLFKYRKNLNNIENENSKQQF